MRDISVSSSVWCSAIGSSDFWAFTCDDKKTFSTLFVCKSSCFLRKPQKLTKSSPWIWHLLSKRQIDDEDFVNFCGLLWKHEL